MSILTCFLNLILIPYAASSLTFNLLENSGQQDYREIVAVAGSAYISSDDGIQLTPEDDRQKKNKKAGRATCINRLHLWDSASKELASFSTSFSFVIESKLSPNYGNGFTFFLAEYNSVIRGGDAMGLPFDVTTSTQLAPFVAVEFDTYWNSEWDPVDSTTDKAIGDHVGININNLSSVSYKNWLSYITYERECQAWINYSSISKLLSVSFTGFLDNEPFQEVGLNYTVDLRDVLPEWVIFGFSAATGTVFPKNTVRSWAFYSSTLQVDENQATPPSTTDGYIATPPRAFDSFTLLFDENQATPPSPTYKYIRESPLLPVDIIRTPSPSSEYEAPPPSPTYTYIPESPLLPVDIIRTPSPSSEYEAPPPSPTGDNVGTPSPSSENEAPPPSPTGDNVGTPSPSSVADGTAADPVMAKKGSGYMVGLIIGAFVVVALLAMVAVFFWRKRKNKGDDDQAKTNINEFEHETVPRKFSYQELARSTGGFAGEEKLGEGGFGEVYKGYLENSRIHVAVKRVSKNSSQGIKEFASEVKIISQSRHKNLVKLIGWCHEKGELLLVYELMENGSLDLHLFKGKSLLAWGTRYQIAKGLASALLYLHEDCEQCVLHRDVKSSNVILDSGFNAKLGDFGLAKLVDHEKTSQTTMVAGTVGYMAPEYVVSGKASKESDVYSFGVVALEIACGRQTNVEKQARLVDWVWERYGTGTLLEAADPRLGSLYAEDEITCLMTVGLWCAHPDPRLRPSMRQALQVLKYEASLPLLPSKMPVASYVSSPTSSSSYDVSSSTIQIQSSSSISTTGFF